jgi:transcriptional regulator with XRE-family HTH domain
MNDELTEVKNKSGPLCFGKNLGTEMKSRGLTLKQVADLAGGVRTSVVQNWLSGQTPHDLLAVQRLCKSLKVPFSEFVLGKAEEPQFDLQRLYNETDLFEGLCRVSIKKLTPKP